MEWNPGAGAASPAFQSSEGLWNQKIMRQIPREADGGRINGTGNGKVGEGKEIRD